MSEMDKIKPYDKGVNIGTSYPYGMCVPGTPKFCGHPRFYEIIREMERIHSAKNQDYAKKEDPLDNLKQCEKIGIPAHIGCFIRMQDKMSRATNLIGGTANNQILCVILETVSHMLYACGAQKLAKQLDALILLLWGSKKEAQVKDETVDDTLTDLAVYAVLCRVLLEERKVK